MQYHYKATNLFVAFFLCLIISFVALADDHKAATDDKVNDQNAESEKAASVYFSLANEFNAPAEEPRADFDCTDKIYAVANLEHYPIGTHQFSVRWIDPSENLREHTKYDFNIVKANQANTKLWAWLSLSRARGAGMLTWINPAAGLEEFVGEWRVEIRVDDKLISDGGFEVSC